MDDDVYPDDDGGNLCEGHRQHIIINGVGHYVEDASINNDNDNANAIDNDGTKHDTGEEDDDDDDDSLSVSAKRRVDDDDTDAVSESKRGRLKDGSIKKMPHRRRATYLDSDVIKTMARVVAPRDGGIALSAEDNTDGVVMPFAPGTQPVELVAGPGLTLGFKPSGDGLPDLVFAEMTPKTRESTPARLLAAKKLSLARRLSAEHGAIVDDPHLIAVYVEAAVCARARSYGGHLMEMSDESIVSPLLLPSPSSSVAVTVAPLDPEQEGQCYCKLYYDRLPELADAATISCYASVEANDSLASQLLWVCVDAEERPGVIAMVEQMQFQAMTFTESARSEFRYVVSGSGSLDCCDQTHLFTTMRCCRATISSHKRLYGALVDYLLQVAASTNSIYLAFSQYAMDEKYASMLAQGQRIIAGKIDCKGSSKSPNVEHCHTLEAGMANGAASFVYVRIRDPRSGLYGWIEFDAARIVVVGGAKGTAEYAFVHEKMLAWLFEIPSDKLAGCLVGKGRFFVAILTILGSANLTEAALKADADQDNMGNWSLCLENNADVMFNAFIKLCKRPPGLKMMPNVAESYSPAVVDN